MSRYWWTAEPIRHLDDWRREQPYRKVDFAEVTHTNADGTSTTSWRCWATDREPCRVRGGFVEFRVHGTGADKAAAADRCLTLIAEHALTHTSGGTNATQVQG